MFTHKSDQLL